MSESSAALSYEVFVSAQSPTTGTLPTGAPLQWSPLSTTLISGATDAILVDPPFTVEQTRRVGDWIERSGKRLTYIYVTHGHGDQVRRIAAGRTVPRHIGLRHRGHHPTHARLGHRPTQGALGQAVPRSAPRHPRDRPTAPGRWSDPRRAPAPRDRGRPQRQYLADGGFNGGIDAWLRAIDMVRALQPAAVVAGHKDPGRTDDPRILDETAEYLRTARQVIAAKPTAREFFDEMTRRYPRTGSTPAPSGSMRNGWRDARDAVPRVRRATAGSWLVAAARPE